MSEADLDASLPLFRRDDEPPSRRGSVPLWERAAGRWRVRFVGRGVSWTAGAELGALAPPAAVAWTSQRHTTEIATARAGECGVADALELADAEIAGLVVTADCLPLALTRGDRAILVHAGWRGVAGELPRRAAERLSTSPGASGELVAWIGPSIGPCCYEVGDDVAERIVAVADGACVRRSPRGRPHLDLRVAAATQLRAAGVSRIGVLDHCTRCRAEWLWSYRRDGAAAGRNLTLLWREATAIAESRG